MHTNNREKQVDIVLIDIYIKETRDGIEVATMLKKLYPQIEIIFLTTHMEVYNVEKAIKLSPTAYLEIPYHKEELRAILQIASAKIHKNYIQRQQDPNHMILDSEFCYDTKVSMLYCCAVPIHFTKKETALLTLFIENINKTIDLYTIESYIWPEKEVNTNTIRSLIKRLRQKLKHKFIETVSSQGYRFKVA